MKPKHAGWILGLHLLLLILACTRFTAISWVWGSRSWTLEYLQYTYSDGFGYVYQSAYTLPIVLAYMTAFGLGLAGYYMARRWLPGWVTIPAAILCLAGLASFGLEATHWVNDHHLCWIASCPGASLVLAAAAAIRLVWMKDRAVDVTSGLQKQVITNGK